MGNAMEGTAVMGITGEDDLITMSCGDGRTVMEVKSSVPTCMMTRIQAVRMGNEVVVGAEDADA
jgi:hypothetical protein